MICGFGDTGSLLARRVLLLISGLADILLEKLTAEPLLTDRVIKRLQASLGHSKPYLWNLKIDERQSPALLELLRGGTNIGLADLVKKSSDAHSTLECLPLVLKRGARITVLRHVCQRYSVVGKPWKLLHAPLYGAGG